MNKSNQTLMDDSFPGMKITISKGARRSEEEAIARLIVQTLEDNGILVEQKIDYHLQAPFYEPNEGVMQALIYRGVPIVVELKGTDTMPTKKNTSNSKNTKKPAATKTVKKVVVKKTVPVAKKPNAATKAWATRRKNAVKKSK